MKTLIRSGLIAALLAIPVYLPTYAHAQEDAMPKQEMSGMKCPMMGDMQAMHKDMAGIMKEMNTMMAETTDPVMKERLQTMHTHMMAMAEHMDDMHAQMGTGMMGGQGMGRGMMGGRMMMDDGDAGSDDESGTVEDHENHH